MPQRSCFNRLPSRATPYLAPAAGTIITATPLARASRQRVWSTLTPSAKENSAPRSAASRQGIKSTNPPAGKIRASTRRRASLQISDIRDQVASIYPKVMIDGDIDAGAWSCGMVVGLIHDIADRVQVPGYATAPPCLPQTRRRPSKGGRKHRLRPFLLRPMR